MASTISPLRGFATHTIFAADHAAAIAWYAQLFGTQPYFNIPGYSEFRIGDYEHEMGIIDARYAPKAAQPGPGGSILYWHTDDLKSTVKRLIEMGATEYEPETVRGDGFVTASVIDPFGNILGVMFNIHYLSVLEGKTGNGE